MKGAAAWLLIRIACGVSACVVSVVDGFDARAECLAMADRYYAKTDFCLTGACGCQPAISAGALKGSKVAF